MCREEEPEEEAVLVVLVYLSMTSATRQNTDKRKSVAPASGL